MKKLLLLAAALVMSVGAWAQGTTVQTVKEGGRYYIKAHFHSKATEYLCDNGSKLTSSTTKPESGCEFVAVNVSEGGTRAAFMLGDKYLQWTSGDDTSKSNPTTGYASTYNADLHLMTLEPATTTGLQTDRTFTTYSSDDVSSYVQIKGKGTNGSTYYFVLRSVNNNGADNAFVAGEANYRFYDNNWNNGTSNQERTSFFEIEEVGDSPAVADWAGLAAAIAKAETYPLGNGLGQYAETASFSEAYAEATMVMALHEGGTDASAEGVAETIADLNAAVAGLTLNMPKEGQLFRIKGYISHNYVKSTSNAQGRYNMGSDASDDTVFYISGTSIVNQATGKSMGYTADAWRWSETDGTNASVMTMAESLDFVGAYWIISSGDTYLFDNTNATDRGRFLGENNNPKVQNPANHNKYSWILEEVESPVDGYTLQVGETGYASMFLDKKVTIPAGVKVYYCPEEWQDYVLKTVEIPSGKVLPSHTAYIIEADQPNKSYLFPYTEAEADKYENVFGLWGCLNKTDRSEMVEIMKDMDGVLDFSNFYVLSKVNNKLGFYRFDGQTLGANKAFYLHTTSIVTETQGFVLDFGGQTTGVDNVTTTTQSAASYDLQGRRVSKATRGLFIQNGVKVIR